METMEIQERVLDTTNRCDVRDCNAQAWTRLTGMSGSLEFCGNHYRTNEAALNTWAYDIIDEREFIDAK